ncbi:MAG TPA: hypothetical protein VFQ47_01960, partial [Nitrososphaera sp.]|nr:hypothetical protein [Nitrososphaera sp.]
MSSHRRILLIEIRFKNWFATYINLTMYRGAMKYLASNRRKMTIGVFVLGVIGSIALSSYTTGLKFNPNFILDLNDIYNIDNISSPFSNSSSGLVPPQIFEANAQTISQNNSDMSLRQLFERAQQSVVQVTSENHPS